MGLSKSHGPKGPRVPASRAVGTGHAGSGAGGTAASAGYPGAFSLDPPEAKALIAPLPRLSSLLPCPYLESASSPPPPPSPPPSFSVALPPVISFPWQRGGAWERGEHHALQGEEETSL